MSAQSNALDRIAEATTEEELCSAALDYANEIHYARISLLTERLDEIGLRLERRNDVHGLLLLDQILDVLDEVKQHN